MCPPHSPTSSNTADLDQRIQRKHKLLGALDSLDHAVSKWPEGTPGDLGIHSSTFMDTRRTKILEVRAKMTRILRPSFKTRLEVPNFAAPTNQRGGEPGTAVLAISAVLKRRPCLTCWGGRMPSWEGLRGLAQ